MVLHDNKIVFRIYIEEPVNGKFLEEMKKSMLASLTTLLDKPLPTTIEETKIGLVGTEDTNTPLSSFFHVPLIVNDKIVGLINVSSKKPGLYKESDMTVMYQITHQASAALSRLREIIDSEQLRLLTMITSISDGIIMLNREQDITVINTAAKTMLSLSRDSVTMLDLMKSFSTVYPISEKILEAITSGKSLEEKALVLGKKSIHVTITPVVGTGVVISLADITLEKSLAEMKETFTHSIVHELRSPLTAIKAATELMRSEKSTDTPDQRYLQIISSQTKQMLTDIDTLLDAAKLESGKFTIVQKPFDTKEFIQSQIQLFTPQAHLQHITVISDIQEHLPNAYIDPIRMSQVINNLLSNSLKYTHENGTINIKASLDWDHNQPQSVMNPCIRISVSDNGIGIPKEKQSALFSQFIRVDDPVAYQKKGTGLGLFITKGIIEAHGGTISLDSEERRGTTISFTIPIAKEEAEQTIEINQAQALLN